MRCGLALAVASVCLAAGCARVPAGPDQFGDAVQTNIAMQIIDPAPSVTAVPPSEGVRRALMLQRYETDTGRKPEDTSVLKR